MLSFQLRTKIHNDLIHAGIQKERGQADLSQFVHCQGSISAPVSWSHLKRWYWFSLEAWPLRCRCPTDSVSCPLCKALAICLIWLCRQVWWLWEGIFSSTFRFLCVLQQGERDEEVSRRKKKTKSGNCKCFAAGENRPPFFKNLPVASLVRLLWPKNGPWKQSHRQTISDARSSERCAFTLSLFSPTWKHTPDDKKTQRSDSIPVRRQNTLWREDHARQFF